MFQVGIQLYWYGKRQHLTATLCYFKYTMYCYIYQPLDKQFTLYSVNHKNKQTASRKDKSQYKFRTFYRYVLKTLENPWNNPNNGIKLLTCKCSSSNPSSIFFAYQCHVDLVFRILTKLFKNFNKLAAIFSFNAFLIREWLKI